MRTQVRQAVLGAIVLLAAAQSAHAQDARLSRRFEPGDAQSVQAVVDSALHLGLPAEPLVQMSLQGAAKGADVATILTAMRELIADLVAARNALGDAVSHEALVLAAAALDVGVSETQLRRLREHRQERSLSAALAGALFLISRDVSPAESLALVQAMLHAGLSDAEFRSLQRLVDQDMRAGTRAGEAASIRARALIRHGRRLGPGGGQR